MDQRNRSKATYSKELKSKAVFMYLTEKKSSYLIAEELGVSRASLVRKWAAAYQENGDVAFEDRRGKKASISKDRTQTSKLNKDEYVKRLEMENTVLKKLIEYSRGDATKS